MVAGDASVRGGWSRVVSSAGSDPAGVLTKLLGPALRSIGARWAAGDVVADEHRATAVAHRVIGRLGLQFGRPGRTRGTVVVAAPAGDLHALPVTIVADLLRWRGFDVVELGANTPGEAIGEAATRADRLIAVGIVSTTRGLTPKWRRRSPPCGPRRRIPRSWAARRSAARPTHRLGGDIWTDGEAAAVVDAIDELAATRRTRPHDAHYLALRLLDGQCGHAGIVGGPARLATAGWGRFPGPRRRERTRSSGSRPFGRRRDPTATAGPARLIPVVASGADRCPPPGVFPLDHRPRPGAMSPRRRPNVGVARRPHRPRSGPSRPGGPPVTAGRAPTGTDTTDTTARSMQIAVMGASGYVGRRWSPTWRARANTSP